MTTHQPILVSQSLGKTYPNGTVALRDCSLEIYNNEFVVIIGSSGAGKSTLIRCMNRLVEPTTGRLELLGEDITHAGGAKLRRTRCRIGMIFQQFNLVKRLSVLDNVLAGRLRFHWGPFAMMRMFTQEDKDIAFECLKKVGIARALAQEPDMLLADEPIASLDPHSSQIVMDILHDIHITQKIPVVVNLHQLDFAKAYGQRLIGMRDGAKVFDGTGNDINAATLKTIYGDKMDESHGTIRPTRRSGGPVRQAERQESLPVSAIAE